jgi:hypothetical protein
MQPNEAIRPLSLVTATYRHAREMDRVGWPSLICEAYRDHLVAITKALEAGYTGAEINGARR